MDMKQIFIVALAVGFELQAQRVPSENQLTHVSGNGRVMVTTTGAQTNGDCVKIDANGNHVANGSACGGVSLPGSDTAVLVEHPQGTIAGDATKLQYIASTAAPAAPTVTTQGAAGTTHYGYKVAFHFPIGDSAASTEFLLTTGNAVLDETNYNVIAAPACSGTNESVDIFISTGAGNTPNTGWIANVACGASYNHQGKDGNQIPIIASDTTPGVYNAASLVVGPPYGAFAGFNAITSGQLTPRTVIADEGTNYHLLGLFSSSAPTGSQVDCASYRGTANLPLAVQSDDYLCTLNFLAFDGINADVAASIQVQATGISPGSYVGGNITFKSVSTSNGPGTPLTFLKAQGEVVDLGDAGQAVSAMTIMVKNTLQFRGSASDLVCSQSTDIGKVWLDTSDASTTHFKVCANVASSPAWVQVF
jgi:hypothetical protein